MASSSQFDEETITALDAETLGSVISPGEEGYHEARSVWNDRYDRYPAVIVHCGGTADVMRAVEFARDAALPIAVKGGGHGYGGNAVGDDCLQLDLSSLDHVRVDPDSRTARVGPGATWRAIDHETQAFGLATTGPSVSSVGVAGFTLGGGTGHLARSIGLCADNLLSADVVTAEGELVRASNTEHPDLFWALRGGGGNFGIVTAFEFGLHQVGPTVLAGQIVHPWAHAADVLRFYRSYMADAPPAVNCYAFIVPIPSTPDFPSDMHGDAAVNLVASYFGDSDAGEAHLQPLREYGSPLLDSVRRQPYTAFQRAFDDGVPSGRRWCSRGQYISEFSDDAIDTIVETTDPLRGPHTMVYFEPMGGAISDVRPTATAFPHRNEAYSFHVVTGWSDPSDDDELIEWTDSVHEAMSAFSSGGVYVNLLSRNEDDRIPEAYGENFARLREVKADWDPTNVFRTNQNIEPAA